MSNTEKPRLCELLGVEVGEEWMVEGRPIVFRIAPDGELMRLTHDDAWVDAYASAWLILSVLNGNAKITRRSRWMEKDIEDAKAAQQLFPYGNMSVCFGFTGAKVLRADGSLIIGLSNRCFPSVRPGEDVPLDEILEAAP